MQETLDRCRELYNAALQERRDAYMFHVRQHPNYYDESTRKSLSREVTVNYYEQANQLPQIKAIREEYQEIHSQMLQDVLRRVQKAFDAFFRRCKNGEAPQKLQGLQQALSRKQRGSKRRRQAVKRLARQHRKVRNQRRDFLHKASRKLVNTYGLIVFEALQPANMSKRPKPKQDEEGNYLPNGAAAKGGLNKSIPDAGWATFQQFCSYKAEYAGRTVLFVNPRYTSQICSGCGAVKKKTLDERWHSCECGTSLDRDHNSAITILALGRSVQAAHPA